MCSRLQKPRDDALGQNRLAQLSIVLFFSVVIYAAVIALTFFFSFVSFRIDNRLHFFSLFTKLVFEKHYMAHSFLSQLSVKFTANGWRTPRHLSACAHFIACNSTQARGEYEDLLTLYSTEMFLIS